MDKALKKSQYLSPSQIVLPHMQHDASRDTDPSAVSIHWAQVNVYIHKTAVPTFDTSLLRRASIETVASRTETSDARL